MELASPSEAHEFCEVEGTNEPEAPPSAYHVFRWTPGDGWSPYKPGTLPAAAPAVLYSNQAASGPFPHQEISGLAYHCGYRQVWGKTPSGCPAAKGHPKPQSPCFLYSTLSVWSESGLKVCSNGRKSGWLLPTGPRPLSYLATTCFQKLPFPCPHFPGGVSGFTKQPREEVIKSGKVPIPQTATPRILWPVLSAQPGRSQKDLRSLSQP